jgi:uncharacterized protein (DUF342 family)
MTDNNATTTETSKRQRIRVTISKDRLSAMMAIKSSDPGNPEITVDDVMDALRGTGVVHGIHDDVVSKTVADKVWDTPIKVADGDPPIKGQDTKFEYFFNIDFLGAPQEDEDGRIDYRDINYIQNVEKGAVLVRRTLPTPGTNGKGVDGKEILAPRGRDLPIKNGANTNVSSDGLELTATVAGAIVFRNGTVSVKDVVVIDKDVDFNVGNIDCNGSVKVRGKIQSGFKLNVGGDLEVSGNVQDCYIDCRGNILIKGGCFGKGGGTIHADGDVVVKYAEGQRISSGNEIIVGGELLNCHVTAKERVWVKGKKGKIIGGEVKAGKEIRASLLGSDAGTKTVLQVAFDADLIQEYQNTLNEIERLEADKDRVKASLLELYRLQMDGKLSKPKEAVLKKLEDFQKSVPEVVKALEKKKGDIEEKLKQYKDAVIIVEDTIYPGVKAQFGIIYREINEAEKQCKLTLEGNQVIFSEYRPT